MRPHLLLSLLLLFSIVPIPSTYADISQLDCGNEMGVESLEIQSSGSGSVPADKSLQMIGIARNSDGDQMAATISWYANNGSIDWDGKFSPWSKGEIIITACSGNAWANKSISVLQGDNVGVQLLVSAQNLTADEEITLDPRRLDSKGNSAPAFVPSSNWTIPEGSQVKEGLQTTWIPNSKGIHSLKMNAYGFESEVQINVSHGQAVSLQIQGADEINVDDSSEYTLNACDLKLNCWNVSATWSSDLLASDTTGHSVEITPFSIGSHHLNGSFTGLSTSFSIEVMPGKAVATTILLNSEFSEQQEISSSVIQLQAGIEWQMQVILSDAVGTTWQAENVEWRLNQSEGVAELVEYGLNYIFLQNNTGIWELTVIPEGDVPSRYTVEVEAGPAVSWQVSPSSVSTMRVASGGAIDLLVVASDVGGNSFTTDVEWNFESGIGSIENGSSGTGSYIFTPSKSAILGTIPIAFNTSYGVQFISIELVAGPAAQIQIVFKDESEGSQGQSLDFEIIAQDNNGNPVDFEFSEAVVSCTCGEVYSLDVGEYRVELEFEGTRHSLSVRQDGLPVSVVYVDVSSTMFGGMLGNNKQVISIAIFALGGILLFIALTIFKRSKKAGDGELEEVPVIPRVAPPLSAFTQPPPLAAVQTAPVAVFPSLVVQATPIAPPVVTTLSNAMDLLSPMVDSKSGIEAEPASLSNAMDLLAGGDEAVSESIDEGIQEETVEEIQEETVEEIQEEVELIASNNGPMTTSGVVLKSLPGTVAGEEGWYHGIDGKPLHWEKPQ
jgi:hypothetical protein